MSNQNCSFIIFYHWISNMEMHVLILIDIRTPYLSTRVRMDRRLCRCSPHLNRYFALKYRTEYQVTTLKRHTKCVHWTYFTWAVGSGGLSG